MRMKCAGALAAAIALASTGIVFAVGTALAASTPITRAPYVTDLTTTSVYIDWAVPGPQTAGSVIVQKAPTSGACPSSIAWNASQEITTPTTDPLVEGGSTSVSWSIKVNGVTEYQAETPVNGLSPATQYCYAVYSTHSSSAQELWPVQTFTTMATPGTNAPVTFDVIGDTGENLSSPGVPYPNFLNTGQQAIYQAIGSSGAQFLLEAGDVSYSGGTETSYGDLNQTGTTQSPDVSDIFGPQYEPQMHGIPTFVADGNHGQTTDDLRIWPEKQTVLNDQPNAGVYSYGPPPAQVDGISNNSPSDWYAVQDGQVRVYVLDAAWGDSNTGTSTGSLCQPIVTDCKQYQADADEHWQTSSTEYQWLQHDLAAHPGGVKMAVFHYPIRSVNNTQPTDPYLSGLESLLATNGVQVAFNGHAHTYQRIKPTVPGTVTNFVTGGGGGILEPVDGNGDSHGACAAMKATATVYAIGWSQTSSSGSACGSATAPTSPLQVFNYLKVTVNGSQVTVQAINGLDHVFDTATFSYGGVDTQPPSVPTGLATTSVSASSVGLAWNSSTDNVGVTGYDVLRDGTKIGTTTTTTYTDSTVAPGTGYHYTVEAFDAAGNTSAPSTALPVTTPSGSLPTTSILIPSSGATLSGTATTLDASASNATSVEFRLFGGIYGYSGPVVGTATPTYYGWLYSWDTTTVPNGSYALLSEAFNSGGSAFSSGVSITVNNVPPPTTSILIPSNGATLSGTATTLDASASNATSVEFRLFGGIYGYSGPVVGTATPTYYGWLYSWDTTTVPNGSYALLSEAFNSGGSAFSSGVTITVGN